MKTRHDKWSDRAQAAIGRAQGMAPDRLQEECRRRSEYASRLRVLTMEALTIARSQRRICRVYLVPSGDFVSLTYTDPRPGFEARYCGLARPTGKYTFRWPTFDEYERATGVTP